MMRENLQRENLRDKGSTYAQKRERETPRIFCVTREIRDTARTIRFEEKIRNAGSPRDERENAAGENTHVRRKIRCENFPTDVRFPNGEETRVIRDARRR